MRALKTILITTSLLLGLSMSVLASDTQDEFGPPSSKKLRGHPPHSSENDDIPAGILDNLSDELVWPQQSGIMKGDCLSAVIESIKSLPFQSFKLELDRWNDKDIELFSSIANLTSLNFVNNQIGDAGAEALAKLTKLTSLNVASNQIGDAGAEALARLPGLTYLNVKSNQVQDIGAIALAVHPTLTSLNLAKTYIGPYAVAVLAKTTSLTSLNLSENNITTQGAKALAANRSLTQLNLAHNNIFALGAQVLATNQSLTKLNLRNNRIGYKGVRALASNSTLTSLNLRDNPFGYKGARALASNSTLTSLNLRDNLFGHRGVTCFFMALQKRRNFVELIGVEWLEQEQKEALNLLSLNKKLFLDKCKQAEEIKNKTSRALQLQTSVSEQLPFQLDHQRTQNIQVKTGEDEPSTSTSSSSLKCHSKIIQDTAAPLPKKARRKVKYKEVPTPANANLEQNQSLDFERYLLLQTSVSEQLPFQLDHQITQNIQVKTGEDEPSTSTSSSSLKCHSKIIQDTVAPLPKKARCKVKHKEVPMPVNANLEQNQSFGFERYLLDKLNVKEQAKQGDKECQYKLATLYQDISSECSAPTLKGKYRSKATIWYHEAAAQDSKDAQQALISLRDRGLYQAYLDEEAMGWYRKAINDDRKNLDFEVVMNQYKNPIYPLKLSHLLVMPLNEGRDVSSSFEWGAPTTPDTINHIYKPLYASKISFRKYEDSIMAIDPSGDGEDETAYCVAKRSEDYYFITALGGLAGGYHTETKKRAGNSREIIQKLIDIAFLHKVNYIFIEKNNDNSFRELILQYFPDLDIKIIKLPSRIKKEKRIIDTLQPLLESHRLVIDRKVLQEDFQSEPRKNILYKFFYQFMRMNLDTSLWAQKRNALSHDDRLDAVAMAVKHLRERKEKNRETDYCAELL